MRLVRIVLFLWLAALPARAEVFEFAAPAGEGRELRIYSTLDEQLAAPLIEAFQAQYPDVAVRYEDLLTGAIRDRVRQETDAGEPRRISSSRRGWTCR